MIAIGKTETRQPARQAVNMFVKRNETPWELVMGIFSVAYVVLSVNNDNSPGTIPGILLLVFTMIFVTEFSLRCWAAPSRRRYAREHWLDIVSCVPLVGGVRCLRLLRLLKLAAFDRLLRVLLHVEGEDARDTLWFAALSVFFLWMGSAYALWVLEHGTNSHLHTFADSLYWAFITTITVGYGSAGVPATPDGRIVTGLLVFFGIGLVGAASSRLTAWWLHQSKTDEQLTQQVTALRHEVHVLHEMLSAQHRVSARVRD